MIIADGPYELHRLFVNDIEVPIADQWMAKCSCGWRSPVSFHEFPSRDAVFVEIDRRYAEHLARLSHQP